ncbi:hypothetical protein PV703_10075 [Streptomyces sp. ME01-24h]|nr:hypothetical protein [Streptomyces sp. ME01-24h]
MPYLVAGVVLVSVVVVLDLVLTAGLVRRWRGWVAPDGESR